MHFFSLIQSVQTLKSSFNLEDAYQMLKLTSIVALYLRGEKGGMGEISYDTVMGKRGPKGRGGMG